MVLILVTEDIDTAENIWDAAGKGIFSDVVQYLKEKPESLNIANEYSMCWTPLHYAAIHGHWDIVKYLLGQGANFDALDFDKSTPLHYCAVKNHLKIMQFLVEAGANVNALDSRKNSPLHYAAYYGHFAVIKYLLANGANSKLLNIINKTATEYAALKHQTTLVKFIARRDKLGKMSK